MKKVFAFLSLTVGLGLSSVAMAQGGIDYSTLCKWDEAKNPRKDRDRVVQTLEITGATTAGGEIIPQQLVSVAGVGATRTTTINFDRTSQTPIRVSRGNQITVQPRFNNLYWTHFYLYIDYNHDGMFGEDELVSFTHYREGTSGNFVNSVGETFSSGDVRNGGKMPVFIVPEIAMAGQTRARFKADWNSKDPCGDKDLANNRGTICDFTLEVLEEEVAKSGYTFTVKVEGSGTAKVYDILTDEEITDLSNLDDPDQLLELRPKANDGWEITELKIDGADMMSERDEHGNLPLMADRDKTITVKFERKAFHIVRVRYNEEKGGMISLLKKSGGSIQSGDQVEPGTQLIIYLSLFPGKQAKKLIVNGEDMSTEIDNAQAGKFEITVNKNIEIELQTEHIMESYVYEFNAEGGKVKAAYQEGEQEFASGDMVKQYAKIQFVVEPNEGYKLTSIARRDKPETNLIDRLDKIGENIYGTRVIPNDPGFIFTFTKTTGIVGIEALSYGVRATKGSVVVEGARGQIVEIYNALGVRVARTMVHNARFSLSVDKGVYLVKIGKTITKVVVD
ncbi:MAG: DUF6383 domain-containing protein [Porphyromonadaceae bacterium]|nr:DUF6383 domain-containing protein [Porphyromonadaceae bacterium]